MKINKIIEEGEQKVFFFFLLFYMEIFTKGNFGNIDYNKL